MLSKFRYYCVWQCAASLAVVLAGGLLLALYSGIDPFGGDAAQYAGYSVMLYGGLALVIFGLFGMLRTLSLPWRCQQIRAQAIARSEQVTLLCDEDKEDYDGTYFYAQMPDESYVWLYYLSKEASLAARKNEKITVTLYACPDVESLKKYVIMQSADVGLMIGIVK